MDDIKVARGEENFFIWCFFLALVQLVLDDEKDVLFINTSEHFEKGTRQNRLLPQHIDKMIDAYQYRKEEARYARRVQMEEINVNGYNPNISRYIRTATKEAEIDLQAMNAALIDLENNIVNPTNNHHYSRSSFGARHNRRKRHYHRTAPQVGMMFHKPKLIPKSIYDNIAYGLGI